MSIEFFSVSAPAPSPSGKMSDEATIGEMAHEFDVSLRTLRFYEDRGLLQPRRDGVNRYYGAAERKRLRTILRGKQLGFTLTEIGELLGAHQEGSAGADIEEALGEQQILDQIGHLERRRADIETAIGQLRETYYRRAAEHANQ